MYICTSESFSLKGHTCIVFIVLPPPSPPAEHGHTITARFSPSWRARPTTAITTRRACTRASPATTPAPAWPHVTSVRSTATVGELAGTTAPGQKRMKVNVKQYNIHVCMSVSLSLPPPVWTARTGFLGVDAALAPATPNTARASWLCGSVTLTSVTSVEPVSHSVPRTPCAYIQCTCMSTTTHIYSVCLPLHIYTVYVYRNTYIHRGGSGRQGCGM